MKKEVITYRDPKSPISEIFRTLRTNIQFMNTKKGLKSLLVTSTSPSEGKSWITSNLAVAFAQAGKKVILVDCDMRKGRQFSIFGVAPAPGLSNFLSGINSNGEDSNPNVLSYIRETEVKNLYLIPAGNIPPNPSELLVSEQMVEAMNTLEQVCDLVIYDGTPSNLVTDAIIISRYVDTTLIVTAYKETKMDDLEKVKKDIENVGGKIAGVVINKMPVTQKEYYTTYYYGSTGNASLKMKKENTITKQEEQIKIDHNKETVKAKAKEVIRQNKEGNTPKSSIYDFEKDMQKKQNMEQKIGNTAEATPAELLKQMNEYIHEEKQKLKKGEE
ncbi:MAG: polysaccharide biosynthesis tyrosine autokinase [Clostridia bacterium]